MVFSLAEKFFPLDLGISFKLVRPLPRSVTYTDGVSFVVYEFLFIRLGVRFPLSPFGFGVLDVLNVCPAQLHYNDWLCVRVFELFCDMLNYDPTVEVFFYLFRAGCGRPSSWVEITPRHGRVPFLIGISYCPLEWMRRFLYVAPEEGVHPWWLRRSDCRPIFPLSWSRPD